MPRKELILTEDSIEEMAALGLTQSEISDISGVAVSVVRKEYETSLKRGRARLAQSLRKAQIKSALSGNASLLIWLGKVYLGQRDVSNLELNAEHRAISITPNVLERLQTSYKLTMEQVRARGALPTHDAQAPAGEAGGVPGDRVGGLKMTALATNSAITNGEGVA
jgi:hypothetical protein